MKTTLAIALCIGFTMLTATAIGAEPKGVPAASTGKSVYKNHCATCHDSGFKGWMTGAPTIEDHGEWAPFFKKGLDKMTHNVVTGEKKHEKKGGCKKCSPEGIRNAIDHIVKRTPKK